MTLPYHIRFGALFIALFFAFQAAYYAIPDSVLQEIIHYGIVDVAAAVINVFSPGDQVNAYGQQLVSSEAALEVIRGCDGSGAAFMLIAAVIALGAPTWRHLLAGVLGAAALMYVLNQIRIVALYYVLSHWPGRFDDVHEYVAPIILIIISTVCFLAWALHATRSDGALTDTGLDAAAPEAMDHVAGDAAAGSADDTPAAGVARNAGERRATGAGKRRRRSRQRPPKA
jgi:exosortase family protein XrtM